MHKSSKHIERIMEQLDSNKLPLGFLTYIKNYSINNKNEFKKMIECMLMNFNLNTNDQLSKFAYNES